MKKIAISLAVLSLVTCFILLVGFFSMPWIWKQLQPSSSEYLNEYILNPTPEGTVVTEIQYFTPVFGDGSLIVELEFTESGMKALMNRYPWKELKYSQAMYLRARNLIKGEEKFTAYGHKLISIEKSIEILVGKDGRVILVSRSSYE